MSDILAPTIQLNRKPDTGDSVKAKEVPKYDLRLQDVPDYDTGWLQAGSEAFKLADHIDLSVRRSRAQADYNDFRIKMDQVTTDLISSNKAGMTDDELRAQVYDEMQKYANDNLLSKEYMDDPRVKNEILKDFNNYVVNISNTIYGDNVKKVQDTAFKEASSSFMMALNDAATAHNTPDGAKYEAIAKEKHDALMRIGGIDPDSEQGKAGWKQQHSNLILNNVLQDLADPGLSPWSLRAKVWGQKGIMMIEDYTRAMNAINAAIDSLTVKAETQRQLNLSDFRMSIGKGDDRDVAAAAMDLANSMKRQNAELGEQSPYHGMAPEQINQKAFTIVRESQIKLNQQFSAETGYMVSTQTAANDFLMSLGPANRAMVVEYFKSGQADDKDMVMLSHGVIPIPGLYPAEAEQKALAELQQNRFVATEGGAKSKAFDSFSDLKRNVTMDGITSTTPEQREADRNLAAAIPKFELRVAFMNSNSMEDFGRNVGIRDSAVLRETYAKAQGSVEEVNESQDETVIRTIAENVARKFKGKTISIPGQDKNGSDRIVLGATYLAITDDFAMKKQEDPSLTLSKYYSIVSSVGYTDEYIDRIKSSNRLTNYLAK